MKFLNIALLAFASCILAKNIIYLDDLVSALSNEKREAKNIASLDILKEAAKDATYDEEKDKKQGGFKIRKAKRDVQNVLQPTIPSLQSLLPKVKSVSIISSYLRKDETIVKELENSGSFFIIVAPTDEAFSRLSKETGKKPWEVPQEIKNDDSDEEVIKSNLRHLVKAHVSVPIDKEVSEIKKFTLLNGHELVVEHLSGSDNYMLVVNGKSVPVSSIHQADNGVVFVVDAVLD